MATESPIRISEAGGKWSSLKEAASYGSPSRNMAAEDLVVLLKGHRFHVSGKDVVPNRSGSAPPSIEGSFHAIENLLSRQSNVQDAENLSRSMKKYDGNKGSSQLPQGTLSTHKEEPEDDQSPFQPELDKTNGIWNRPEADSLASRYKNVVELIQQDFPRTPSPVYSKSITISHGMPEEAVDLDAEYSSSHNPSVTILDTVKSTNSAEDTRVSSSAGTPTSLASSSSLGSTSSMGLKGLDVTLVESQLMAVNISEVPRSESQKYEEKWKHNSQNNLMMHQIHQQQINPCEAPTADSHGVKCGYVAMDQFPHNPSKFSDVQPVLQSSGFTPPLYATAAAYMTSTNPFYSNLQYSGLYSPQYVGGYTYNPPTIPPYVAAYPPHAAVPVIDGAAGSSFSGQTPGVSTSSHGTNMVHANKLVGQFGFPLQPSFDPVYMQYHQQTLGEGYGFSGHLDSLASRASAGNQIGHLEPQKRSNNGGYLDDQKFQHQRSEGHASMNSRRGRLMVPSYFGDSPNMGFVMQYPTSPLPSPLLPGYPEGGTGLVVGRNEMKFSPASDRNVGLLSGWQGQRIFDSAHDPKIFNFLEELKSGKGRRFELSDIIGHIVEFSADQHGSRFIQQKLENCGVEEKALVFKEVLPHASKLMTDVFGNYVIQKFFEYGSPEQRKELANQLTGQILPLSLQMYGCRVIQKALEVIELEQKAQLVHELDGHVMRCIRDQNGNHVIQKCIERIPTKKIGFITSAFRGQVATLSTHPYGCRVVQRVLERCTDEVQCQFIVDEILESVCTLAQDQYGNYVTQHVLERGRPHERSQIIKKLSGHIVQLSQHKFASNVVEKCLEHGDDTERELLIAEIVGHDEENDNLLIMMKDQFANYVVQKVLEICSEYQRAVLLSRIRAHAHALKKYTYGKHIVTRLEQLFGEGSSSCIDIIFAFRESNTWIVMSLHGEPQSPAVLQWYANSHLRDVLPMIGRSR